MSRYRGIKFRRNLRKPKTTNLISALLSAKLPEIVPSDNDVYIITKVNERLDILASNYYSDPALWWIIAKANNQGKGTLVVDAGIQLRIPAPERVREIKELTEILNR